MSTVLKNQYLKSDPLDFKGTGYSVCYLLPFSYRIKALGKELGRNLMPEEVVWLAHTSGFDLEHVAEVEKYARKISGLDLYNNTDRKSRRHTMDDFIDEGCPQCESTFNIVPKISNPKVHEVICNNCGFVAGDYEHNKKKSKNVMVH